VNRDLSGLTAPAGQRCLGLDRVSVSLSVGVPKSVCLEQLERFNPIVP